MSFDGIAPHYRWLERLTAGSLLQRCRTAFLERIREARNVLLLGEGRGRFLGAFLDHNPGADITCLDASARMLDLARAAAEHHPARDKQRIRFVRADILDPSWSSRADRYDAVASHFFLDCFPPDQLARVCRTVSACTRPGASWLISDFCVPEQGWRRVRARCILWMMYRFFRVATGLPATHLTAPDPSLTAAGFDLEKREHFSQGLLHSDVWVLQSSFCPFQPSLPGAGSCVGTRPRLPHTRASHHPARWSGSEPGSEAGVTCG